MNISAEGSFIAVNLLLFAIFLIQLFNGYFFCFWLWAPIAVIGFLFPVDPPRPRPRPLALWVLAVSVARTGGECRTVFLNRKNTKTMHDCQGNSLTPPGIVPCRLLPAHNTDSCTTLGSPPLNSRQWLSGLAGHNYFCINIYIGSVLASAIATAV